MSTEQNTLLTIDEVIKRELTKFNQTDAAIAEINESALALSINGIDDKDGYSRVSESLKFVVRKRNEIEAKRKELKEDSLKYQRAVDGEAKRLTALLSPAEAHLKSEKERIDNEIKRRKEAAELEAQRVLSERKNALHQTGAGLYNDEFILRNQYTQSELSIHILNLETLTDEEFDIELLKFKNEQKLIEAETERQKEEREKRDELIRKQNELLEAQTKQLFELRKASRELQIERLGIYIKLENGGYGYHFSELGLTTMIDVADFTLEEEEWNQFFDVELPEEMNQLKFQNIQRENQRKEREDKLRKEGEERLIKQKQEEEALEQERISSLKDSDKMSEYCKKLLEIEPPAMSTKKWASEINKIKTSIQSFVK